MGLDEFIDMFQRAELLDENFGQREIGPQFNISIMTNKNEIASEKHLNMKYVEFMEALARCADRWDINVMTDFFPEFKSKNPFLLDKKLESIIIKLIKACFTEKMFNAEFAKYKEKVDAELNAKKPTKFAKI